MSKKSEIQRHTRKIIHYSNILFVTFYKILNPKLFKTHVYNTSYHLHYLYTIQKSIQPWSIFHLLSTLIQKNNPERIFFTFFVIIHCDEWAASHSSLSIVCLICISSEIYIDKIFCKITNRKLQNLLIDKYSLI